MDIRFWDLREEIYEAFHNWPLILLFLGLGSLVGWLIAFLWPADYHANAQIYVALNPYRAYSDSIFLAQALPRYSNIDDYKDWQMAQLESAIFTEEILSDTIEQLRSSDNYWEGLGKPQMHEMLDANWRSAGIWSLIANHPDPERAEQVVTVWQAVVLNQVKQAIEASRQAIRIDQELQSIADQQYRAVARRQELSTAKLALQTWLLDSEAYPPNLPLAMVHRWEILALGSQPARFTPAWMELLDQQPPPEAIPSNYQMWARRILPLIEIESSTLQDQIQSLIKEKAQLAERYDQYMKKSLALSPGIEIQKVEILPAKRSRSTATMSILGGIVGLLVWFLTRLEHITYQRST